MEALIAALIAGGLLSMGAHLLRRARRRSASEESPQDPRGSELSDLRPGDLVSYQHRDLVVLGVARLSEGRRGWREHRLEGDRGECWLVVSPTDPGGVLLGQPLPPPEMGDEPPQMLDHADQIYQLQRCGQAEVQLEGAFAGLLGPGSCDYWDYARPGPPRLWLRRSGERWTFCAGQRIPRHFFAVIPAAE
jgi:hypothetical protein